MLKAKKGGLARGGFARHLARKAETLKSEIVKLFSGEPPERWEEIYSPHDRSTAGRANEFASTNIPDR